MQIQRTAARAQHTPCKAEGWFVAPMMCRVQIVIDIHPANNVMSMLY